MGPFTNDDTFKILRDLVELDYDAVGAYEAAIARIDDPIFKAQLSAFCDDHRRHIADLNPAIQELGGQPVLEGDFKQILITGKVVFGGLVGDKSVLMAMKSNEDDTNEAYEKAIKHRGMTPRMLGILTRNLGDERRHRAYIEQAIASLAPRKSRTSFTDIRASSPSLY